MYPYKDNWLSNEEKIKKIENNVKDIMITLWLDLSDDSLQNTPKRVAKMYVNELFRWLDKNKEPQVTVFENKMNYDEIVLLRDIKVMSTCEHHLVLFVWKAYVWYIPRDKIIWLSKISRIVDYFSRKPQIQERLTEEIYEYLKEKLNTKDIAIVIKASHYCYDKETEILTNYWWKLFKDVNKEDFIWQYDLNTNEIDFVKPLKYIEYNYNWKIYDIETKSTFQSIILWHNIVFQTDYKFFKNKDYKFNKWKIENVIKNNKYFVIPRAWKYKWIINNKIINIWWIDWDYKIYCKFMWLYLSEWCYSFVNRTWVIRISQNKKSKFFNKFVELFKEIPLKNSIVEMKNQVWQIHFTIRNIKLAKYLEQFWKSLQKYIPYEIKHTNIENRESFLEYFFYWDWYETIIPKNKWYITGSKKLANDIQEMLVWLNKWSNIILKNKNIKYKRIAYQVAEHKDKQWNSKFYSRIEKRNIKIRDYNDKVYSFEMPKWTLITRKNYKIAISWNCMISRWVEDINAETITSKMWGKFLEKQEARNEFLKLINING